MKLSVAATTGERCACGAPIYSYLMGRRYRPDEPMPHPDQIPWHWEFLCEWGHRQIGPDALLTQASIIEEYQLEDQP